MRQALVRSAHAVTRAKRHPLCVPSQTRWRSGEALPQHGGDLLEMLAAIPFPGRLVQLIH